MFATAIVNKKNRFKFEIRLLPRKQHLLGLEKSEHCVQNDRKVPVQFFSNDYEFQHFFLFAASFIKPMKKFSLTLAFLNLKTYLVRASVSCYFLLAAFCFECSKEERQNP